MTYHQITSEERYQLAALDQLGTTRAAIARRLGRHRSTIGRELRRNRRLRDGAYRPRDADTQARDRRSVSRRNRRFTPADWQLVTPLLEEQWSPEQVAGYLRRTRQLRISHETIYRYVWEDKFAGGQLYQQLRGPQRPRLKRGWYHHPRGRMPSKRLIGERPAAVDARDRIGHWEIDTVHGHGSPTCLLSLVERKTGYLILGQLAACTAAALNQRLIPLIRAQPRPVRTITADNGSELDGYPVVERATGARFYFATPHHAWERGTNENTNGLIRQYLPKGHSMARLTQRCCTTLAHHLNQRPRKRLGFRTPEECYASPR